MAPSQRGPGKSRTFAARDRRQALFDHRHRRRRHRRRHHRRDHRHGRPSRGQGLGMIDMAGLAQKGGAVFSHVKLARRPEDIHAIRVAAGDADLILGCDLVVSGAKKVLAAVRGAETGFVVNSAELYPGDFTRNADYSLPGERLKRSISAASGGAAKFVDATAAANALVGNAIGANTFMLGYAYQAGYVPLSSEAIRHAIELNGEAVAMNLSAFDWGRAAVANSSLIEASLQR